MLFSIITGFFLLMIAIVIHTARGSGSGVIRAIKSPLVKLGKHPTGMVFGKIRPFGRWLYSPENTEGHVLVLGGSGLGKTTSVLMNSLIHWHGPAFVIDVAGDISSSIGYRKGRYVIEPFGSGGRRYDVFAAIDRMDDKSDIDLELMKLAILLMPETPQDSSAARYYHKGGLTIIQAALICGYHQGLDFTDICRIVRLHSIEDLFDMINQDPKAASIISPLVGQDPVNLSGCKDMADSAVELFAMNRYVSESIGRGKGSVSPADLEEHSIYVVIPTSELTACSQLMHIISAQVIDYVLSRRFIGTEKKRILLCLDELTSLGKLDYLLDLLARSRKNGVRVMALTQSMADLEMVYPREHRSMMENFAIKIILGADEVGTQKALSDLIGDQESPTGEIRKLYRPVELSKLDRDLLVIFRGGCIRCRKVPFYTYYKPRIIVG